MKVSEPTFLEKLIGWSFPVSFGLFVLYLIARMWDSYWHPGHHW